MGFSNIGPNCNNSNNNENNDDDWHDDDDDDDELHFPGPHNRCTFGFCFCCFFDFNILMVYGMMIVMMNYISQVPITVAPSFLLAVFSTFNILMVSRPRGFC